MKYKSKFKIGDWVVSSHVAEVSYNDKDYRTIISTPVKREIHGQVVGAVYRHEGYVSQGMGGWSEGDYDPPYLSIKNTVLLLKVLQGMTNKPIEVFEKDLSPAIGYIEGIPWRHMAKQEYSSEYRRELSIAAKDMPRDGKGRFQKSC